MLTVRELIADLDVRLVAGAEGLDLPVRWVHMSELLDPTPWLSGGEVLLTTGMQLQTPRKASASSSSGSPTAASPALGFGTGFGFDDGSRRPSLQAAAEREFPRLRGPLRAAVHRDHRSGVHAARQRAVRGPAPRARGAGAPRADRPLRTRPRGARRARSRRCSAPRCSCSTPAASCSSSTPSAARSSAGARPRPRHRDPRPQPAPRSAPVHALDRGPEPQPRAAGRHRRRAAERGRLAAAAAGLAGRDQGQRAPVGFRPPALRQSVTIIALELLRARVAGDTERRLAGDVLARSSADELRGPELSRRLEPFGLSTSGRARSSAAHVDGRTVRGACWRPRSPTRCAPRRPRVSSPRPGTLACGAASPGPTTRICSRSPSASPTGSRRELGRPVTLGVGRAVPGDRCAAHLPRGALHARGRRARARQRHRLAGERRRQRQRQPRACRPAARTARRRHARGDVSAISAPSSCSSRSRTTRR